VNFLYFPTWYRGLDCEANGSINIGQGTDLSTTIFKIALNIIGIVAVIMITLTLKVDKGCSPCQLVG